MAPSVQSTCRRRLVKLSRASVTPGRRFTAPSMRAMQAPQAMPSTARSMPSVPSPDGLAKSERSRASLMVFFWLFLPALAQRDAAARAEHPLIAAIKIDDQFPLPRLRLGRAVKDACGRAANRNDAIESVIGRMRQPRIRAQVCERRPLRIAHAHVEHRNARAIARERAAHLPMQSILPRHQIKFLLKLQAGLVRALSLIHI